MVSKEMERTAADPPGLADLVESVCCRMRDLHSWRLDASPEDWSNHKSQLLRDLERMDRQLAAHSRTLEDYGWTEDGRGGWRQIEQDHDA